MDVRIFKLKYSSEIIIGELQQEYGDCVLIKNPISPQMMLDPTSGKPGITFIPVLQFFATETMEIYKNDCLLYNKLPDPNVIGAYNQMFSKIVLPNVGNIVDISSLKH